MKISKLRDACAIIIQTYTNMHTYNNFIENIINLLKVNISAYATKANYIYLKQNFILTLEIVIVI